MQNQKLQQTIAELEQKLQKEQEKSKKFQQELDDAKLAQINSSREQLKNSQIMLAHTRAPADQHQNDSNDQIN